MDLDKVGIVTTVSNWDLYNETINFFPPGIRTFAIDGTKGFFGLNSMLFSLEKLKKYNIDWLIMADEDVIFTNHEGIFDLIDYLEKNNYIACGMRDGGVLSWRDQNPYLLNTFFTILNLNEIYKIYNEKEVLDNQYIKKGEFEQKLDFLPYNYQVNSLFEPYYCFFLWLLRKEKKIKYLDGYNPEPNETTIVLNHLGKEILYHTWYARLYKKDEVHTKRIENVLSKGKLNFPPPEPVVFINYTFHIKKALRKLNSRIKNKLLLVFEK